MGNSLTFTVELRPWTVNRQRSMHHYMIARLVQRWRHQAQEACEGAKPLTPPVQVSVTPILRGKRKQDVGACYPAVKAAIDGMVDAGVIPDDTPENLISITMYAPIFGMTTDCVVFLVHEVE